MALADDLVAAAAKASRAAYERRFGIPEHAPATSLHEWTDEARAAVAATLRAMVARGDYPTDRRSLLELADVIERAGVSGQPASEDRNG